MNLTTEQPDNQGYNAQNTVVISSNEDFPQTFGLCKKIAVYLVAIFWISISCIQLLLGIGSKLQLQTQRYNFETFIYAGNNRSYANFIFMFWLMTLFANIMLLSGIVNKNR